MKEKRTLTNEQKKRSFGRKLAAGFILCVFMMFPVCRLAAQTGAQTSIAMLNYLATEARIINSSSDNRLILENIYNKLVNNSNPTVIDSRTLDYFEVLLDCIEDFRMITYQRERLQYIFQNQQAQAFTQAMPNPMYLLFSLDKSPLSLIASAAAMTMDSVFKYQGAQNDAKLAFMQGDWELDDKESAVIHSLRSRSFAYMVNIAAQYRLAMDDTLNEKSIDDFVAMSLWEASQRKRHALEANQGLYRRYAPYWLVLAETYYELGLYRECLDAAQEYERVQAPIFRKDKDFAKLLPKVIVAALNVYNNSGIYANIAERYLQIIVNNTSDNDWALRYFAAQTYISLASNSNRTRNLQSAYDLLLNNVRVLSVEQEKLLNEYYSPVSVIPQSLLDALDEARKNLTNVKISREMAVNNKNAKIGKAQRAQFDREIREAEEKVKEWERKLADYTKKREMELPPFSNALWVNYELLKSLFEPLRKRENDIKFAYDIIDHAFWPLKAMELFSENQTGEDINRAFFLSSNSRSFSFLNSWVHGWNYGSGSFFIICPDAVLTAVSSIDVRIINSGNDSVIYDEKNVQWGVSSALNRNYFKNPKILSAEIAVFLKTRPVYAKNESYIMEIRIKNIDEEGLYNSLLCFEMPAGRTDWRIKYVK